MSQVTLRRAGALLIAAAAITHLHTGLILEFEEYFEEYLRIGIMFLIGSAAALISAFLLLAGPYRVGWNLGALVAGGMLVGFVISRTVGLVGFDEQGWDHWNEPQIWLSFLIEGLFLAAWVTSLVTRREDVAVVPESRQTERQLAEV